MRTFSAPLVPSLTYLRHSSPWQPKGCIADSGSVAACEGSYGAGLAR
jgi:hypothetical protein